MDRMRRVSNLWNWLPTFRAVAETGHLRQAADRLHLSPSALSRTIRLLEDDLGEPLFDRIGRRLKVNQAGETLLNAVRDSMRLVHDATLVMQKRVMVGPIRIHCEPALVGPLIAPTLVTLRESHPDIIPTFVNKLRHDSQATALLLGDIDILIQSSPIHDDAVAMMHLGESPRGIYCNPDHPLRRATVTEDILASCPFVAPPPAMGHGDGWPSERPRTIGAWADAMETRIHLCTNTHLLGVFPDVLVQNTTLHRLAGPALGAQPFYIAHRPTLSDGGRTECFLDAVRAGAVLHSRIHAPAPAIGPAPS